MHGRLQSSGSRSSSMSRESSVAPSEPLIISSSPSGHAFSLAASLSNRDLLESGKLKSLQHQAPCPTLNKVGGLESKSSLSTQVQVSEPQHVPSVTGFWESSLVPHAFELHKHLFRNRSLAVDAPQRACSSGNELNCASTYANGATTNRDNQLQRVLSPISDRCRAASEVPELAHCQVCVAVPISDRFVYVYMCACMFVCCNAFHIYTYIRTSINTQIYLRTQTYKHICMYTSIHACHTYMQMQEYTEIQACICVYANTYIRNTYMHINMFRSREQFRRAGTHTHT